ncbi:acyl carrier protein [Bacillus thuringiensis]|uniref:acyl carrier protein n=1 Tax=Bacillus thuringiensis TaxID=1428 RepID=UPI003BF9029B
MGTSGIHGRKCLQLTFSISITEDIVMEEQLLRQIESIVKNKKNTFESEVTDILESITFIKIIVAIEKTYGFEFDDAMLLLSEFPTIGSLINYVVSKVESLNVQIKNV